MSPRCRALFAVLLAAPLWAAPYADPGGTFSIDLPAGWSADRQEVPDLGVMTRLGPPAEANNPLAVFVATAQRELTEADLPTVAGPLLGLVVDALRGDGELLSNSSAEIRFLGRRAVRGEMRHKPADQDKTYLATARVVVQGHWAYTVLTNVLEGDQAAVKQLDTVMATLVFGGQDAAAPADDPLRQAAARRPEQVLVAGEPPLTVASVTSFASLLAYLFDVQLTEAEYQTVQTQLCTDYRAADATGRQVLATSAATILATLQRGDEAERAKNKTTVQTIFTEQLQTESAAGHPWARVLWTAVERRRQTVARTTAQPTAQATDTEMSEADLDAAVELLQFMWVAAGRDPAHVTPQHMAEARAFLAQAFPRLPQGFQLLLANAQTVYSRVRGAWQQADAATRAALAKQFEGALCELGLKNPAAMNTGGAWDDVDPSTVSADLVQVTCYNLAQKSTGGAWR